MRNLMTSRIILIWVLSFITLALHSQVTVGDGVAPQKFSALEIVSKSKGGLRLPQLTTDQRNEMTDAAFKANNKAPGLAIYNLDTDCYEYWNGSRWVSLCEGNSQLSMTPTACSAISADGTGCDSEFTVSDPDCPSGPFSFTIISGSDFASLSNTNPSEGTFNISFLPNNSINLRSAVVRITSNCSSLYKDFLFTQLGQSCNSSLGEAPAITSVPAATLNGTVKELNFCSGGYVYLSIPSNSSNIDEVIWTRNGVEFARGVSHISVNQSGVYDIWVGTIGCNQKANNAITVKKSGTNAPDPVEIVVKGNNGIVCSSGETTTLIAQKPSMGGTVRWFKDGVLQSLTTPLDNQIEAGVGQWFAVVNDGNCWSKPSEFVNVMEQGNVSGALIEPVIESNGSYCAGSTIQLSVSSQTYDPTYTYTWYQNNDQLSTGRFLMYTVPSNVSSVVIRCRATKLGSCAAEAIGIQTITAATIPARPSITGNTVLCSGTATLNIIPSSPGDYTYAWYKNSELIGTSQSINITTGGDYYASITEVGGCTSPLALRTIPELSSAVPMVTFNSTSTTPNLNDVVTYGANINFGPAISYKWTITNATLESGGGNTPTAVVRFDKTGAASVRVEVTNACGTGSTANNFGNISAACINPKEVYPSTDTNLSTIVGTGKTLGPVSVSFVSGSPVPKYQWYRNTTNSSTGGTAISGATSNTYIVNESTSGTYYYYCEASNAGCASTILKTGVYTLTVNPNPGAMQLGAGTFTGTTCFDINKSNFDPDCGLESDRDDYATNFATLGPVNYAFTASATGTKSNLRFIIVDPENVIDSYTANNISGTIANNQTATLVINYKTTLSDVNGPIYGRTREQAATVRLYAVYYNGSTDVSIPLIVNIQDCACCGGSQRIGARSYLTSRYGIDCWMVENSKEGTPNATYFGSTITGTTTSVSGSYRPNSNNNQYYYGNSNNSSACPKGWHVPTYEEGNRLRMAVYYDIQDNGGAKGAQWWAGSKITGEKSNNNNATLTGGAFNNSSGPVYYYWRSWSIEGYWWLSNGLVLLGTSSGLSISSTNYNTIAFLPVRCVQDK